VLSGIHTQNFDRSGFNQWQIDDTTGQVRTRLATSTAATQLNLGYLIEQSPGSSDRGGYRGSGFELRTDAWGVLRGGEGVLLSTSARSGQGSGIASTQMDVAEAVSLFKGAEALSEALGNAAAQQQALFSKDAAQAQTGFIEQIDPKAKGKFAGAVNGQQAVKAKSGTRELDAGQPVEKFGSSIVLMDSAASINWATPASTVIYAGQQLHWTTQSDLHMAAAHTLSSVAGNATSLFTHSGGIQAIAANGPVSLQAHTDQLEILADEAVTVISVNDSIEIKAKEKIVLQAGQSAVTLEGGDITFACPGKFSVKGGQHLLDSGVNKTANIANLPGELAEESKHWIALHYLDPETNEGIAEAGYEIHFVGGPVLSGTLDRDGKARHENVLNKAVKKILYKPRQPSRPDPAPKLEEILNG
jgi:type VI secretion system secreted protein VgrG